MWMVGGSESFLKMSAPQLLQFESTGVLNIFSQRMTHWLTWQITDKGIWRTAPPTPGLLITLQYKSESEYCNDTIILWDNINEVSYIHSGCPDL